MRLVGLLVWCAALAWPSTALAALFDRSVNLHVGPGPHSLVVADVTGDHRPDVVVMDEQTGRLLVLRGDGTGGAALFSSSRISNPFESESVCVADVNGDGRPDVAVPQFDAGLVDYRRNIGSGRFHHVRYLRVGSGAEAVTVADVNGDGRPDIVVSNLLASTVSVLLGRGGGRFASQRIFTTGAGPAAVATGDLNHDGRADVVVANGMDGTLTLLLSTRHGLFRGRRVSLGSPLAQPEGIAVADVYGDGRLDVIVADRGMGGVDILAGDGHGHLGRPVLLRTTSRSLPEAVAVGDVNGDGVPDLITANYGSASVSVALGGGHRRFGRFAYVHTDTGPIALVAADLNDDGRSDVVVANYVAGSVTMLRAHR
jgi:hypothetical protein